MKPYGIDGDKLRAVAKREALRFDEMLPKSKALLERARKSQPNAVPMAWMVGLYEHLPMFVSHGSDAWFTDVDGNRFLDMSTQCHFCLSRHSLVSHQATTSCLHNLSTIVIIHLGGVIEHHLQHIKDGSHEWVGARVN